MNPTQFGTSSPWETALTYFFTLLLFGMFFAAILVPVFWILSNLRDRWNDYTKAKRARIIAGYVLTVAVLGLIFWRGAMPSNF